MFSILHLRSSLTSNQPTFVVKVTKTTSLIPKQTIRTKPKTKHKRENIKKKSTASAQVRPWAPVSGG